MTKVPGPDWLDLGPLSRQSSRGLVLGVLNVFIFAYRKVFSWLPLFAEASLSLQLLLCLVHGILKAKFSSFNTVWQQSQTSFSLHSAELRQEEDMTLGQEEDMTLWQEEDMTHRDTHRQTGCSWVFFTIGYICVRTLNFLYFSTSFSYVRLEKILPLRKKIIPNENKTKTTTAWRDEELKVRSVQVFFTFFSNAQWFQHTFHCFWPASEN